MKIKLRKIKLHSAVELNDREMKAVRGSYGTPGGGYEHIPCYVGACMCTDHRNSLVDDAPFPHPITADTESQVRGLALHLCRDRGFLGTPRCTIGTIPGPCA